MLSLLFSTVPAAALAKSPADAATGTIGKSVVGPYELRDRAVTLAHLAEMSGGTVVGRAPGSPGAASEVDGQTLREIIDSAAEVLLLPTRLDAAGSAFAPTVGAVRVLGYQESGDGGASLWKRATSEPGHPGKLRTADGAWWELAEPVLRPEMFGAVANDGVTDEGDALRDALTCAIATGRILELSGTYATYADLAVDTAFHLRGVRGRSRIVFYARSQLRVKRGDGSITTPNGAIDGVIFQDGGDVPGWIPQPLLEIWRAFHWRLESCEFDGRVRRRHGAWLGRGSTLWASTFADNRFHSCQYGVVIGDITDATHNDFVGNTCDHNRVCGAVFVNPHGGVIESNSFEHNEGPVGFAVTSFTNGGAAKAVGTSIRSNYVYNNNLGGEENPLSAGILVGVDVPGGLFSSGGGAWNIDISNNYIVSPTCWRAIRANMAEAGSIRDNVVTRAANSNADIELDGMVELVRIEGNKNQNRPEFNVVAAPRSWRVPAATVGGRLMVDGNTASGYAISSAGAGGSASPLVTLEGNAAAVLVLGSVEREDGSHAASFIVHFARGMEGALAPVSVVGELDGATFQVSGNTLMLRRDEPWVASCSFISAGSPQIS